MEPFLLRSSNSFSSWWRCIDYWIFGSILFLIGIGIVLMLTASPAVALQHHWSPFVLFKKHLMVLVPGLALLVITSTLRREMLVFSSLLIGCTMGLALVAVTFWGVEVKGARRWLSLGGFSLQPSEILKTAMVIFTAWVLSRPWEGRVRLLCSLGVVGVTLVFLLLQPDFGMAFLVISVFFCQCFLAGLSWLWIVSALFLGVGLVGGAYVLMPHVAHRVNDFLFASEIDRFGTHYQISKALSAFAAGKFWGRGLGAGEVLNTLPDSHNDFIFAAAGEELGLIACLAILALYGVLVFRGFRRVFRENDLFYVLAIMGLTMALLLQVFANVGSVLRLIPTKGAALPFLSYGGSSFLSLCWLGGMLLNLTRRHRSLW